MKILHKTIIFSLLIIFAISCVPSKPVYEEEVLPADRLVKRLEANRRKIKTFEGSGVLDIKSPKLDAKASFEIYLKKPDSLKLVIYGPFGIDIAQALVTNSEFTFYNALKNVVYKGRTDNFILKRIFHIDLSFSEMIDAFAGAVNLTDKLRLEPDEFKLSDKDYNLTYIDSLNGKQSEFVIQINNLAIKEYRLYKEPDILLFQGNYSDFEVNNRVPIPYRNVIQNILENQKVIIDYRNINVNEKLNNLTLEIPSDARIKYL